MTDTLHLLSPCFSYFLLSHSCFVPVLQHAKLYFSDFYLSLTCSWSSSLPLQCGVIHNSLIFQIYFRQQICEQHFLQNLILNKATRRRREGYHVRCWCQLYVSIAICGNSMLVAICVYYLWNQWRQDCALWDRNRTAHTKPTVRRAKKISGHTPNQMQYLVTKKLLCRQYGT